MRSVRPLQPSGVDPESALCSCTTACVYLHGFPAGVELFVGDLQNIEVSLSLSQAKGRSCCSTHHVERPWELITEIKDHVPNPNMLVYIL